MAKDKDKKKSDETTSSRFKKPSEAPAGGDGWKLESDENDGKLLLITPLRKATAATKEYGDKEVIVADIVVINRKKPEKSEEHEDVYVWGAWLQGSIRSSIGTDAVLGVLDKADDKKSGKGYVWKLEDADDTDAEAAEAYFLSTSPFKKKAKDDADEKPAKKKDKGDDEKPAKKKSKK